MNTRYSIIYLTIFVFAFMAFVFEPGKELDLYRWFYEEIPVISKYPLADFISDQIDIYDDFMYQVTCILAYKNGISLFFINSLYVGLYYYLVFKIINLYISINGIKLCQQDETIIILYSFISVLPILVFSIARMLASVDIIFLGIYFLLKKKRLLFFILLLFSLVFHVGSIIFIFILFVGFLFYLLNVDKWITTVRMRYVLFSMLGCFLILFLPSSLNDMRILLLEMELFGQRYQNSSYLNSDDINSVFESTLWYLKTAKLITAFVLFVLIVNAKKIRIPANFGIAIYIVYCFVLGSMSFVGDRIMMFMPIYNGILMYEIVYNYEKRGKNPSWFFLLICFQVFITVLSLLKERECFFPFLY